MMTRKDLGQYRTIPAPVAQPCAMRPGAISSSACHTHQRPVWECIHMLLDAVETLQREKREIQADVDALLREVERYRRNADSSTSSSPSELKRERGATT